MPFRDPPDEHDPYLEKIMFRKAVKKGGIPLMDNVMEGDQPWEQLIGEPKKAYAGFAAFRDQGPMRTIANAARAIGSVKKNLKNHRGDPRPSTTKLWFWAREFHWQARVEMYDKWIDKVKLNKAKEDAEKMVERHLTISATVQSRALKRLREMSDEELVERMGPGTILKYLTEGVKMERSTRGQPNVIVKNENTPATADDLDDEATAVAKQMLMDKINAIAKRKSEKVSTPETEQKTETIQNRIRHIEIIAEQN
jgi:hypothetical protein